MYISYDKLWKLLIDKQLKKTDLISLCKISSRTLTKLSKNENVNTDTLIRICEALSCGIEDICTLRENTEPMTLYEAFRGGKKLLSSDDYCKTYSFEYKGKRVILTKTKKKANKYTVLHCKGSAVTWEQITQISIYTSASEYFAIDLSEKRDPETVYIVVISGTPNHFKGLDEGIFVSVHGKACDKNSVYVMSEAALKVFDI
ncbi:MAG: helix-turn-helix transcriptional regulator [Ruminococcaceae bacterium]|nr:helix-turn-helix transcriptional regulator [Oscillospiraceae bacterium]